MITYAAQLQDMTRNDLYKLAQDAKIPGRSKMTKDELLEALTAAQTEVLATMAPEVQEYYEENDRVAAQEKATSPQPDHNAVNDQVVSVDLSALPILVDTKPQRVYTTPAPARRVKALITRTAPGGAFFQISDGPSGIIVRSGRVFTLVTGSGETITVRARTMVKALKRLAVKLGIYLNAIDTVKAF